MQANRKPHHHHPPPADESPPKEENPFKGTRHKYKAMGREVEVDYDELLSRASKADGADQKFNEAAKIRKSLEEKLGRLSNAEMDNWEDIIELVGWEKAKKFAETLVWNNLQYEELPQSEKDRLAAEKRAAEAERKLKEREDREAESEKAKNHEAAVQIIDKEIGDAIAEAKKEGLSVADAPEIIEAVVDEMIAYLEFVEAEEKAGRRVTSSPPSPKDVIRKIQGRYDERSSAYLKRISPDALKSMLTKEQLNALRQSELDHLYAPIPSSGTKASKVEQILDPFEVEKPKKNARRMKSDQWFKAMDAKFGG